MHNCPDHQKRKTFQGLHDDYEKEVQQLLKEKEQIKGTSFENSLSGKIDDLVSTITKNNKLDLADDWEELVKRAAGVKLGGYEKACRSVVVYLRVHDVLDMVMITLLQCRGTLDGVGAREGVRGAAMGEAQCRRGCRRRRDGRRAQWRRRRQQQPALAVSLARSTSLVSSAATGVGGGRSAAVVVCWR